MRIYSGFVTILGFMLVFRTSQAMNRFTTGLSNLAGMNAQWFEACSSLVAFSQTSKCPAQNVRSFQHLCVRLFSMLHAAAMQNIADIKAAPFDVIENGFLDVESLAILEQFGSNPVISKVRVIHHWIGHVVLESLENGGVLSHIPAPILTRFYQEMAQGNYECEQALTITHVPFPYPYAQMTSVMLLLHGFITPFFVSMISVHWAVAATFSFFQVAILWGINFVAAELQQPFQEDANDLPMTRMHKRTLESLALLLDRRLQKAPYLEFEEIGEHDGVCKQLSLTNMRRMSEGAGKELLKRASSTDMRKMSEGDCKELLKRASSTDMREMSEGAGKELQQRVSSTANDAALSLNLNDNGGWDFSSMSDGSVSSATSRIEVGAIINDGGDNIDALERFQFQAAGSAEIVPASAPLPMCRVSATAAVSPGKLLDCVFESSQKPELEGLTGGRGAAIRDSPHEVCRSVPSERNGGQPQMREI